jgi:hypothetical protein
MKSRLMQKSPAPEPRDEAPGHRRPPLCLESFLWRLVYGGLLSLLCWGLLLRMLVL